MADFSYVSTWTGNLNLGVVLDAWGQPVVARAMATHLGKELLVDPLQMPIRQHRPKWVIHHSDQGSQYAPMAFGKRCREAEVRPSIGSTGNCCDNALSETFFATLECQLLDHHSSCSQSEAARALFEFAPSVFQRD